VVNQKQGVSALGLQRVLGLGSYQTAWAWLHKLRRAMVLPGRELLTGVVEVDESYFGARRPGAAGRGVTGKPIVAIAVEDRGEASGRVRMRRLPDVTKPTLTDFVLDHVTPGAEVQTDGWQGYFDIGRHRFRHVVTNVSASGDPAHVVLPHVHRLASLVRRWMLGTPGRDQPPPARLLPRRVHLPLQPPSLTPPRTALLPAAGRGRGRRPPPLQDPHQQIRRVIRATAESGERSR